MTSESLIRKYIASVLAEGAFIRNKSRWKKFLQNFTGLSSNQRGRTNDFNFFSSEVSQSNEIAKNWLNKRSKKIEISKELKSKVYKFAEDNYENFLERAEGDADLAAGYLMSALTRKFLSP